MKRNRKIKTPRVSLLTKIRETEQKRFLSAQQVRDVLVSDSTYSEIMKSLKWAKHADLVKYSQCIINSVYFENKLNFLLNERALDKYFFECLVSIANEHSFVTYLQVTRRRMKRWTSIIQGRFSYDVRDECMLGYVIELVIRKHKVSFLKNILLFYRLTPDQECSLLNSYRNKETELNFYFEKHCLSAEAMEMLCLPEYGKMFECYNRYGNISMKYHWKRFLYAIRKVFSR